MICCKTLRENITFKRIDCKEVVSISTESERAKYRVFILKRSWWHELVTARDSKLILKGSFEASRVSKRVPNQRDGDSSLRKFGEMLLAFGKLFIYIYTWVSY